MGVLPLQFADGENAESLGLTRRGGVLDHRASARTARPRRSRVKADDKEFTARVRIDTPKEVEYFRHGGILPYVLRQLIGGRPSERPRRPAPPARRRPARPATSRRRPRCSARPCAAFAEVTHDTRRLDRRARAPARAAGRVLAIVGHIDEIGLIVHHIDDDGFLWFTGVGGWDPVILVGQRVEIATRDGAVPGVVGKKPIHLLDEEERKKAPELKRPAHRHRREGRRRGARAGARRRRRGDRRRAGRAAQRPRRLALDGQPPRLLRRLRGGAARRRGGRRARRRLRGRRRARRRSRSRARARPRSRSSPTSRSSSTSPTRPTRPASTRRRSGATASAPGPVLAARRDARPAAVRAAARGGRGRGDPVHRRRPAARSTGTDADAHPRSRAPASRPASSRCRCATCTRRSRWSSSTTCRTPRG